MTFSTVVAVLCLLATDAGVPARVISVSAKKFEYTPSHIEIGVGEPVVLELTSLDRRHGFNVPELGISTDIQPGHTTRVSLLVPKPGVYRFRCNVFCGGGHEDMTGELVVK